MKFKVSADLPDNSALAAGLQFRVPEQFERIVKDAEKALAESCERRADASRRVDEARELVARGAAAPQLLEEALHRFNAANQVIEPAERRVASAIEARTDAVARAKKALVADAVAVRDELQAAADRVTPLLEELKVLENTLDNALRALGEPDGVPAVRWPACVADDVDTFNAGMVVGSRAQTH